VAILSSLTTLSKNHKEREARREKDKSEPRGQRQEDHSDK